MFKLDSVAQIRKACKHMLFINRALYASSMIAGPLNVLLVAAWIIIDAPFGWIVFQSIFALSAIPFARSGRRGIKKWKQGLKELDEECGDNHALALDCFGSLLHGSSRT